jgi:hypothetical protein
MNHTTAPTTVPTGAALRAMIDDGSIDLPDAVRLLHPDRGDGRTVYPWEVPCGHPEPAQDCRVVTGRGTHGADWCYACWLGEWERRAV